MSTATPTGDGEGAAAPWLPDEATLTRLANQFFAEFPGQPAAVPPGYQPATALPVHQPAIVPPSYQPAAVPPSYQPAIVPPSYQPAIVASGYQQSATVAADLDRVTVQPARLGPPFALPRTGQPDAPSFYFVDEPPSAPVVSADAHPPFDVGAVRRECPVLGERVNGRQLVWLDNAATTQKPQAVIDRLGYFYAHENSNVHRGAHALAVRATCVRGCPGHGRGLPRRAVE